MKLHLSTVISNIETSFERVSSAVWSDSSIQELGNDRKLSISLKDEARASMDEKWVAKHLIYTPTRQHQLNVAFKIGVRHFLRGLVRGIIIGLGLKGGMGLLFSILQRKSYEKIVGSVFNKDVFKFTSFLAAYLALLRGSNAFLASYSGKNEKKNAVISGAIASVAILLDDPSRRKDLSLYLFFRGLDVMIRMLVRLKHVPHIPKFDHLVFGIVNMPIMWGFLYEPEILAKSYYHWILNMGNIKHETLVTAVRQGRTDGVTFIPCCPAHHVESHCSEYIFKDWFYGLHRAGKIYLPVHLLPLILFRWKLLTTDKAPAVLMKTAKEFIASCMFLSTYQSLVKANMCFWRGLLKSDSDFIPPLGGLMTGMSCLFEKPSRVSELLLYCCPRGAEAGWNFLLRRGLVNPVPFAEVAIFSVASALLVSASKKDFKPTYYKALSFLIGS